LKTPADLTPRRGRDPLRAAIGWLLRLREDRSDEALCEFEAWRDQSPDNGAAWEAAVRAWDLTGVALATAPASVAKGEPSDDPDRSSDR